MNFVIQPGGRISGEIHVDGDKSISHRAIMFGAISQGVTRVRSILEGEDVIATMQAFSKMGVNIEKENGEYRIHGVGLEGLRMPVSPLDMGNSGRRFDC